MDPHLLDRQDFGGHWGLGGLGWATAGDIAAYRTNMDLFDIKEML